VSQTAGSRAATTRIELAKHILDKGLVDRDNLRCGNVDDLVLEVADGDPGAHEPELLGLISGPLGLVSTYGRIGTIVMRALYQLIGIADPHPVEIGWRHVRQIDAVVRLDISRDDCDINALADAVRERLFAHLPGA